MQSNYEPPSTGVAEALAGTVMADSEWAGTVAADAFRAGRVRLGAAFARIAIQALEREEAAAPAQAPIDGLNEPIPFLPVYQGVAAPVEHEETAQTAPPPTARCAAVVGQGASAEICHGAVYWTPGQVGIDKDPPVQARWNHVHPNLDEDHRPLVTLQPQG